MRLISFNKSFVWMDWSHHQKSWCTSYSFVIVLTITADRAGVEFVGADDRLFVGFIVAKSGSIVETLVVGVFVVGAFVVGKAVESGSNVGSFVVGLFVVGTLVERVFVVG